MNKTTIFYGSISLGLISGLIAIYYIVPGFDHILVSGDPAGSHFKHFIAFAVLAAIFFAVAVMNRNKK